MNITTRRVSGTVHFARSASATAADIGATLSRLGYGLRDTAPGSVGLCEFGLPASDTGLISDVLGGEDDEKGRSVSESIS